MALGLIITVWLQAPRFWWPQQLITKLLYGFLAVCAVSAALSASPAHALKITLYTGFVVMVALAVAQVAPQLKPRRLLIVVGWSAGVACLFGLYQFVADLSGLPMSTTGLRPIYSGLVFGFPRIQAASLEPLYFANYLLLPISLVIGLKAWRWRSWGLGVLLATTLFLTLSRGGVAAMLVVGVLWVAWLTARHQWSRLAAVAGAAAASLALTVFALAMVPVLRHTPEAKPAIETYAGQITSYEVGDSSVDRAYTRNMAWQAFRENPVLGVGPGNFGRYISARNTNYPDTQIVNNEPLEILAETGLLGLLTLLAFGATLVATAFIKLRRSASTLAIVGWAALFYLVGAAVQYYSFSTLYVVHIWVVIGLLWGTTHPSRQAGKLPL